MIHTALSIATIIIRFLLAIILFRAALHKMRHYRQFETELNAYQLIPETLLSTATILLTLTETFTSITLLNAEWFFPCVISAALFLLYGFAMAINLLKGRMAIDCGCGGPLFSSTNTARKTISWALVARNVSLTLLALLCALTINNHSLNTIDYTTVIFGSLAVFLLYEAIEQTIINQQTIKNWRKQTVNL